MAAALSGLREGVPLCEPRVFGGGHTRGTGALVTALSRQCHAPVRGGGACARRLEADIGRDSLVTRCRGGVGDGPRLQVP
jgi:hypothetical protein